MENDKWLVGVLGKPGKVNEDEEEEETNFEIFVYRTSNSFAIESFGWFGPNKLLVGCSDGASNVGVHPFVWDGLIKLAYEFADKLNKEDQQNDH